MNAYDEQENLCERCGISCHPAIQVGRLKVVLKDVHCRFLELDSEGKSLCSVYETRFEEAPWCMWADEAQKQSLLSVDCPYHRGRSDQKGKTFLSDSLLKSVAPQIAGQFVQYGVPEWVSTKGLWRLFEIAGFDVCEEGVDDKGRRRFRKTRASDCEHGS